MAINRKNMEDATKAEVRTAIMDSSDVLGELAGRWLARHLRGWS